MIPRRNSSTLIGELLKRRKSRTSNRNGKSEVSETMRIQLKNRMGHALNEANGAIHIVAKTNLGNQFKFLPQVDHWEGMPRVTLRLINKNVPTENYPYYQVMSDNEHGAGAVTIVYGEEQRTISVIDDRDYSMLPETIKATMEIFLEMVDMEVSEGSVDNSKGTRINIRESIDQTLEKLDVEENKPLNSYSITRDEIEEARPKNRKPKPITAKSLSTRKKPRRSTTVSGTYFHGTIDDEDASPLDIDANFEMDATDAEKLKKELKQKKRRIAMETARKRRSASVDNLEIGSVIAKRYELLEFMGSGSMGTVFRAKDLQHDDLQEVAVKILHHTLAHEETIMQRFFREVALMKKINHEHVIRTFDMGSDGDIVYFTMEFVKAESLAEVLDTGALTPEQFIPLSLFITEGLEAIHQADVIHRDLKPENILLTQEGQVKITDFGVARPEESNLTMHREIIGSIAYIAPEIWLGKVPTKAIDLYSLGVIFYTMSTGELPFEEHDTVEMMKAHVQQEAVSPKQLNPAVPQWYEDLILKLLAKNPEDRFQSAEEVSALIRSNQQD